MEYDDLSPSDIRRVANYSPYLDQIAGFANEMGLRQRSNLVHLERCLHDAWSLGQNSILSWCSLDDGVLVFTEETNPSRGGHREAINLAGPIHGFSSS